MPYVPFYDADDKSSFFSTGALRREVDPLRLLASRNARASFIFARPVRCKSRSKYSIFFAVDQHTHNCPTYSLPSFTLGCSTSSTSTRWRTSRTPFSSPCPSLCTSHPTSSSPPPRRSSHPSTPLVTPAPPRHKLDPSHPSTLSNANTRYPTTPRSTVPWKCNPWTLALLPPCHWSTNRTRGQAAPTCGPTARR